MATINLLKLSLSSPPSFTNRLHIPRPRSHFLSPPRPRPPRPRIVNVHAPTKTPTETSFLLEVNDMMCGACVSRVRRILSSDERVESAVVNMVTETAAVRLKPEVGASVVVAEEMAAKLTECGYGSKRRVAGSGVGERVRKWKEVVLKKKKGVVESRNRVVLAWCLVALCCGDHAAHLLHSLGIHVSHGGIWDVLHNSYVKGGVALGALRRDLLFDGLRAFMKGSPNMNSLVGFGSAAAFILSVASLVSPELEWNASFFDEPDRASEIFKMVDDQKSSRGRNQDIKEV